MTKPKSNLNNLVVISPIINAIFQEKAVSDHVRERVQALPSNEKSPFAKVPGTYTARLFVLDDLVLEGLEPVERHLQSKYLVFNCHFHGELAAYLKGLWESSESFLFSIWSFCVGYQHVKNYESFERYVNRCKVPTHFSLEGVPGGSIPEQLKALYLKQEFAKFVADNQGKSPETLQAAFQVFIQKVQLKSLEGPTWQPGQTDMF